VAFRQQSAHRQGGARSGREPWPEGASGHMTPSDWSQPHARASLPSGPMSSRQARVLVAVAALLLAVASGAGGNAAAASRGGCELSSTTCYFFDVSLSGSGSGTY